MPLFAPWRTRPVSALLSAAWLCAVTVICGCSRCRPGDEQEEGISLEYTADASRPRSGVVAVELILRNLPPGDHVLEREGNPRTTEILGLEAHADGRALRVVRVPGNADRWTLTKGDEREVRVRWRAKQGGLDRHGHEGFLGTGFGLIEGGAYLVPRAAIVAEAREHRGRGPVARVRARVKAPGSWQVVSSMRPTPDGLFDPALDGRWAVTHLAHSNTAIGAFDLIERRIGAVRVRVYLFRAWPQRKKGEIAAKIFRIYETFDQQTPCRGLEDYTVIVLPAAPDGESVTGQFWSTGQAFSHDAYASRPRRFWELLAHRMAHCVNRYPICGMHFDDPLERWFVEGWASWSETSHTKDVLGSEQRLVELGKLYRGAVFGISERVRDEPVIAETERRSDRQLRYLHYVKAPLVVGQLDYELRLRSGGKKTANGLMAKLHARYGGHRGSVPLRAELRAYAGRDMSSFFSRYAQQPGFLYPLHDGFLDHLRKQALTAAQQEPALRVNGLAIGAQQHVRLVRLLKMMKVEDPAAVRERLVHILLVFAEYQRQKLAAIPPEMIELVDRLPASVRLLLFRHQVKLLFGDEARFAAWATKQQKTARVEVLAARTVSR